jgi:hypothetical protein
MNDTRSLVKRYSAIAWGIIFLWLGVLMIVPGDQNGPFILGVGIVFLGLNVARRLSNIPVNAFSITLGILALAGGIYALVRPLYNLPHFQVEFIPLVMIVAGLYVLIPHPRYAEDKQ